MLLAHRVPAILCACIRRQCSPLASPFGTGAGRPAPRGGGDDGGDSAADAPPGDRFLPLLAPPAVRALACLVHPSGPHWRPIRPMPFSEAAVAAAAGQQQQQQRQYCAASSPSSVAAATANPSTAAGLAVDVNAAVELATSVWRQTAKHLLERTENSGSGGRSGDNSSGGGGGRVDVAAAAVAAEGKGLGFNAVATLCGILCQTRNSEGCCDSADDSVRIHHGGGTPAAAATAPFCGHFVSPRGSSEKGGGPGGTREAALRVLLHSCRASPGIAHAVAAFDGGAAVQALLGRLCLPSVPDTGPNVSEPKYVRLGQLFAAGATEFTLWGGDATLRRTNGFLVRYALFPMIATTLNAVRDRA